MVAAELRPAVFTRNRAAVKELLNESPPEEVLEETMFSTLLPKN